MISALRAHWLFLLLAGCGAALRVVVQFTYEPAIFFFDSYTYLEHTVEPRPDTLRPLGYPTVVLRPLLVFHDLAVIPAFQHLLGLGMAVAIYAVLLRRGLRHWLAALAAAPILLDAYLLQIEQNIASDSAFLALIVAALVLVTWREQPSPTLVGLAGLCLGLAATMRFVGVPLVAVALVYLLIVSRGWLRVVNVGLAGLIAAVPLLAYSTWSYQHGGNFQPGGNNMSARTIYARTAPLADCGQLAGDGAPVHILRLCPNKPASERTGHPHPYMRRTAPVRFSMPNRPPGVTRYEALRDFALRVTWNQPLDVTTAILDDFSQVFAWRRTELPETWRLEVWRFDTSVVLTGKGFFDEETTIERFGGEPLSVNRDSAEFLRAYQSVAYTRGPVFALGAILPLVALFTRKRARGYALRAPALLVAGTALTLLLSAAAYSFSWRYQLPAIPLLPWAAALGLAALVPALRRPLRPSGDAQEGNRAEDDEAAAEFWSRHGGVRFAPLVVVVAAYNERESIGTVIDEIPGEVLGMGVDVLVVDDGSDDATADVVAAHTAHVCRTGTNRGQGAALRLGYRIAREGGARYIATTDADGQYDARELPTILQPLVDDEADFVTGSRRLGRSETTDKVRALGVRFFAFVISVLTRTRLTDPANGFRAMRAEVTDAVGLRQRQYQAAELLIGALAHGFRVTERPTTMRKRAAGESKKGGNLLYGARFARVVVGTWLRERTERHAGPPSPTRPREYSESGR